jgi:hypothetical protein
LPHLTIPPALPGARGGKGHSPAGSGDAEFQGFPCEHAFTHLSCPGLLPLHGVPFRKQYAVTRHAPGRQGASSGRQIWGYAQKINSLLLFVFYLLFHVTERAGFLVWGCLCDSWGVNDASFPPQFANERGRV